MEEIRLWVKDVGFPIAVAIAAIYALYRLFFLREDDKRALTQAMEHHAETITSITKASNVALGQNTIATQELSQTIKKKLGPDSDQIAFQCRAPSTETWENLTKALIIKVNEEFEKARAALKQDVVAAKQEIANEVQVGKNTIHVASLEARATKE